MKLPGKDTVTAPWMSQREIPAVKAMLSAWRRLRKDKDMVQGIRETASVLKDPQSSAQSSAFSAAWELEVVTAIDERLRKEVLRP